MEKSPDAFRTISEVAEQLDVPQHVLRFWESRFHEIRPMKRGGGRRYYRPDDVDLLRGIRHLLYGEGYTIRGVQRLLREQGQRFVQGVWQPGGPQPTHQPSDDEPDALAGTGERALMHASSRGREDRRSVQHPEDDESTAPGSSVPVGLAREHLQKLQAALRDLTECRRLLDAARSEKT